VFNLRWPGVRAVCVCGGAGVAVREDWAGLLLRGC
jgi:hypothetical protein